MVATKEGNPIGPTSVDEREEEHVHHPTLKPRAIASIGWQKLGHLTYRRTKEHAIEYRVDDVAHSTSQDKRHACHKPNAAFAFANFIEVVTNEPHRNQTEDRESQFAPAMPRNLHTKGHAVILNKMQTEPTAQDLDLLAQHKVGLDPNLKHLVYDEHCGHHRYGNLSVFCHQLLVLLIGRF